MFPIQTQTNLSGLIRLRAVPKLNLTCHSPDKSPFLESPRLKSYSISVTKRETEQHQNLSLRDGFLAFEKMTAQNIITPDW